MPFRIVVTRDYDQMSEQAAAFCLAEIRRLMVVKERVVLGLATGRSPAGLYKHLAKAANRGTYDSGRLVSFNLDEYVGLPGENAQQRTLHPESYSFYMIRDFFGLLHTKMVEANLPWGTLIEQRELERALRRHPEDWELQGESDGKAGKAIVIRRDARNPYLAWVRREILDGYVRKIRRAGGIDLQVVGVGSKGHVAFHEAGIPWRGNPMLLVRLDEQTINDAVRDGHFPSRERSPRYAVSMGLSLVFRAPTVVLLASGGRKVRALSRALFERPSPALPLSYVQHYVRRGGNLLWVIDRAAAVEILPRRAELARRGIAFVDRSDRGARVKVDDLHFACDPLTGLMR